MSKHSAIRAAVLAKLKADISDSVTWFDGRPAFLEEGDLPAVAVYLSDAEYTGATIDADDWQATLHIEVFLKASNPDTALDTWLEEKIYPALQEIPGLEALIEIMTPQGYDYQRDDEMATWGSVDLTYSLTYSM
ncbi:phage tail protein [Enterobacter sp. Ap-916]|uniref:phage minor tail U family protein n=1 Tax=unclassified Enterobacter TaxID=2608935 RepID=UPI00142228B5|nr:MULTISPECIES: phage minor tail U family protein [unclassified Enterobacter]NIF58966.1 phage tail protein [Enterobacter sp. Ap-867]NIG29618.1 phage tail protein [Enterobacter sp. Ap-916]